MSDTLIIDSAQIARWQAQNDFDYNRELVGGGMTFSEWLQMQFSELMNYLFGEASGSSFVHWMLIILAAGALAVIGWYLWRYHPGLFISQGDIQQTDVDTDDTIYGVDFDRAITHAVDHEDYREAIRLVYLKTLKALADANLIDWQLYKTPSQYVREFSASSLGNGSATVSVFRTLTAHFLRVRYGNFPTTRLLYDEVEKLGKEVHREP